MRRADWTQIRSGKLKRLTLQESKEQNQRIARLLLAKDVVTNTPAFLYNWTVGLVASRRPYVWTEAPINLGHVIDVINRVHAHEILVNGVFNGDPHPGNILLCPDGRIGLIDYGQVGHAVLCGLARCCAVVCGLVRSCAVLCGLVRSCAVLCGLVRSCAVLCGLVRCFVVLCGLVRHDWRD